MGRATEQKLVKQWPILHGSSMAIRTLEPWRLFLLPTLHWLIRMHFYRQV